MLRYSVIGLAFLLVFTRCASAIFDDDERKVPSGLKAMLEKADRFELLSLNAERDTSKDAFHGWKVVGTSVVKDQDVRRKLIAAFEKGVAESKGGPAFCFDPHHGIRVTRDGKTADFVVCFDCFQVRAHVGDVLEANLIITNSPRPVFDSVLDAGNASGPKTREK
jgi:hypothetical protein